MTLTGCFKSQDSKTTANTATPANVAAETAPAAPTEPDADFRNATLFVVNNMNDSRGCGDLFISFGNFLKTFKADLKPKWKPYEKNGWIMEFEVSDPMTDTSQVFRYAFQRKPCGDEDGVILERLNVNGNEIPKAALTNMMWQSRASWADSKLLDRLPKNGVK